MAEEYKPVEHSIGCEWNQGLANSRYRLTLQTSTNVRLATLPTGHTAFIPLFHSIELLTIFSRVSYCRDIKKIEA